MDPSTQELLDSARHGHDATDADRARVRRKLAVRLAAGAALGGSVAKASTLWTSTALKIVLPVMTAAALGGYVLYEHGDGVRGTAAATPVVTLAAPERLSPTVSPVAMAAVTTAEEASASPAPPTVVATNAKPKAIVQASPADLEAETRLLAETQGAMQRSDFTGALAKLDEWEKAFPAGVLTEERTAARVVALCGAGRKADAQALGKSFLARYPRSPLAPRVKSSCGHE